MIQHSDVCTCSACLDLARKRAYEEMQATLRLVHSSMANHHALLAQYDNLLVTWKADREIHEQILATVYRILHATINKRSWWRKIFG